jgi:hypothetical protein
MELLKDLYEIHAPSNGEKKIKKFIKRWVGNNIPDAKIRKDNNDGNIYIVRGYADTYPCVVAHLDQVQKNHSADFVAVETDDIIFGYSSSNNRREGLGADDKNGIWVALNCLMHFDVIKVAFFVGEESGCIGSSRCDMRWFDDCRFVVEPDRRGANDLITDICGRICSEEFERVIDGALFGYKPTHGMMTDVMELSERNIGISCINLSCGYYEPHTDKEYTIKADLINCLNFVKHIIATATDVYPHKYENDWRSSYSSSYYYGSSYYSKWWEDYDKESKRATTRSSEPNIIYISEFADLEAYVDQLIYMNFLDFSPDELWPYIESDLATYEITKDTFMELAWDYYEFYWYNNSSEDDIDWYSMSR